MMDEFTELGTGSQFEIPPDSGLKTSNLSITEVFSDDIEASEHEVTGKKIKLKGIEEGTDGSV